MKYLSHICPPPLLNKLAFYALLGSGAYIILLWSPNILGRHVGFWTRNFIYILPWLMLWLAYSWQLITAPEHRLEIILMISIIILGVVNASLSNAIETMRIVLLTGLFALWTAMFLITDPRRRQVFDWFCAGALAVIILVEIIF